MQVQSTKPKYKGYSNTVHLSAVLQRTAIVQARIKSFMKEATAPMPPPPACGSVLPVWQPWESTRNNQPATATHKLKQTATLANLEQLTSQLQGATNTLQAPRALDVTNLELLIAPQHCYSLVYAPRQCKQPWTKHERASHTSNQIQQIRSTVCQ